MKVRPLRKILFLQAAAVSILPFSVLVIIVAGWLYPQTRADVEMHQRQLANTITAQIESHLTASIAFVNSIADIQRTYEEHSGIAQSLFQRLLHSSGMLNAAYVVGPDGRVISVALSHPDADQQQDLIGLDLSYNSLYRDINAQGRPFWSDTFLSVVGGGLSVAYGRPAGRQVVIGEIDLTSLTQYLKQVSTVEDQWIFIVDRRGQVIADQDGRYTAQQLNLSNIKLLKEGLKASTPVVGHFQFAGETMIGSLIEAKLIDWHVLVFMPELTAMGRARTTIGIFATALLVVAVAGIGLALFAARRLAQRFETIARHARNLSEGKEGQHWPAFSVAEFQELTIDLKQMADSMRERETYSRTLFSDSPVPLLACDPATMQCTDANRAAMRVFDLARREAIIGKHLPELSKLSTDSRNVSPVSLADHFRTCIETGFASFEWTFQNPNGRTWSGDVNMSLLKSGDTDLVQLNIQDITQRKEAQAEKEKLQAQFQQAQKLESVGRLAGGVAHDLNNLLSPILGYGELLQASLDPDDSRIKSLQEIVRAGMRARDVVRQLLAFSRKQTMEFKPIDLNDVMVRFQTLLRRAIREDIFLKVVPEPSLPMIRGDIGQLEQVIMNLAVNAQDAMPDGGVLTIEVAAAQIDAALDALHEQVVPGRYVVLMVSDTGQGMDPETRKNIFEPFFTTKEVDKGTGLGLATVYGIIKQHDGNIGVESAPGRGSTFKIYLPVTEETAVAEPRPVEKISNLEGSEVILLVEDNARVRDLALEVLRQRGYRVHAAADGAEALKTLEKQNCAIDLLLTDVVMPGLNGRELYEEVSRRCSGVKALYMSGYSDDVIARRGVMEEGIQFLQKPFSIHTLTAKVRQVLDQT